MICLVTSYLLKVNHYIFDEVREGKLTVRGFYPDWAEPTAKLVRILLIVAAAIVGFPYLPGSNGTASKGISVCLGILLSLGSTSAVAHGVAVWRTWPGLGRRNDAIPTVGFGMLILPVDLLIMDW